MNPNLEKRSHLVGSRLEEKSNVEPIKQKRKEKPITRPKLKNVIQEIGTHEERIEKLTSTS